MEGRAYKYLTKKPQYPFGYGLTYSDVKVTDAFVDDQGSKLKYNRRKNEKTRS